MATEPADFYGQKIKSSNFFGLFLFFLPEAERNGDNGLRMESSCSIRK